MKLSDYFDKIFIIGSVNSPKVNHTIESLKKLGLYDENVITYIYPILDKLNVQIGISNDVNYRDQDRISLAISHYSIVKHSYNVGLNKILILEDDNYFYDDISKWEEVLTTMPDDWDFMKFSGFSIDGKIEMNDNLIYNKIFRKIDSKNDSIYSWGYSASAIAFNRNAMKQYINSQESIFNVADDVLGVFKFTDEIKSNLNIYMPTIPLFVPINDVEVKYKFDWYVKYDKKNYI